MSRRIVLYAALQLVAACGVGWCWGAVDKWATGLIFFALFLLGLVGILRQVSKRNGELTRILESLRVEDSYRLEQSSRMGLGYDEFRAELGRVSESLAKSRAKRELRTRYLERLVDQCPVPLVVWDGGKELELANFAARELLGDSGKLNYRAMEELPAELVNALKVMDDGGTKSLTTRWGAYDLELVVRATGFVSKKRIHRVFSIENIRYELDQKEVKAWEKVVQVLAHEMINSLTPVTSLSETALGLVGELEGANAEVAIDLQDALETIVRRSSGLMSFVQSYRKVAQLPKPRPSVFSLEVLFDEVASLYSSLWKERGIHLRISLNPKSLRLFADREQVAQALINLLKNAGDACEKHEQTEMQVEMCGDLDDRGRVRIRISDSGPGVEESLRRLIFVPFFTTKGDGSGIGLGLVRRTMIAHGGSVHLSDSAAGGACFELLFDGASAPTDGTRSNPGSL